MLWSCVYYRLQTNKIKKNRPLKTKVFYFCLTKFYPTEVKTIAKARPIFSGQKAEPKNYFSLN